MNYIQKQQFSKNQYLTMTLKYGATYLLKLYLKGAQMQNSSEIANECCISSSRIAVCGSCPAQFVKAIKH